MDVRAGILPSFIYYSYHCLLVVIFNATTHRLIPLYSVGVFLSFTLAQIGMVINWRKSREKGWKKRVTINGIGAGITILTTLIIVFEKFSEGAWIVTVLIPVIVLSMISIKKHYDVVADMLRISKEDLAKINLNSKVNHIMIVPIASLNKAAINALQYARSITDNVIAINISTDLQALDKLKSRWSELNTDIALVAKYSPYRAILTPLLKYINDIANAAGEGNRITVVLPEFITHKWWGQLLHNHTSFFIRETLLRNENVVVSTYPYHLKDDEI